MSNITNKIIKDGVVIISTEGYFNKDLGEALKELTDDEIKNGHKNVGGSSMAISLDLLNNIDINYETNNFFLQKLYISDCRERDIIHVCVIHYIHNSILK